MAVKPIAALKGYFNTGDTPTEANFADLIDSQGGFETVADMLADTTGYGAAGYAEGDIIWAGGFRYQVVASDASTYHLENAADTAVRFLVLPSNGDVCVTQCGGVEGEDITTALQLAVDVAAGYYNDGERHSVLIDVTEGTLSDTIHVGYGDEYRTVRIRGLGARYHNYGTGTSLTTTMVDRPAFSVTSGRSVEITDMLLSGPAESDFETDIGSGDIEDVVDVDTWDDALTASGITPGRRYAPHCAIAIDPYAGTEPATAYPDVTPMVSIPGFSQYEKEGSSGTLIARVNFSGYEVGVAQTPSNWDNNGDFTKIKDCIFRYVKWAVSYGNSQARALSIRNSVFSYIYCVVTNSQHGKQNGTISGAVESCGMAGLVVKIMDLTSVYSNGLSFRNCDAESVYRIGELGDSSSGTGSIVFDNIMLNFMHNSDNFVPPNILKSNGGNHHVYFKNGAIDGYQSVFSVVGVRIKFDGTRLFPRDTIDKEYEQVAMNALAGGLAVDFQYFDHQEVIYRPFRLSDGAAQSPVLCGSAANTQTGRDYCVPVYSMITAKSVGYLNRQMVGTPRPFAYNRDNGSTLHSGITRSGRSFTFTTTGIGSNSRFNEQYGYMPGDIIQDEATGTVLFIRSTNTGTGEVIAELQNNYYWDGSAYQLVDTSFDLTGFIRTLCGRVYTPPNPMICSITSGSSTVNVAVTVQNDETNFGLATGDYLFTEGMPFSSFLTSNTQSISAIDTGANTITMAGNASQSIDYQPFDWWVRQSPSNSASR